MEDEKKKKRNKKKKNKQIKHAEDGGEATSADRNHVDDGRIAQNGGGEGAAVSLLRHQINAVGAASVEEKIKQLEETTASYSQKEAALEETIKQLRDENGSHLRKEAVIEETVRRLKNENDAHIQKEAKLEEAIVNLRKENGMLTQEKSTLENKMRQLLDERSIFTLKEASLGEKLGQLEQDRASWLAKEKRAKETISSLNNEVTRLRAQVVELEESKSYLLQQNQSLMGNVSDLQLQLQSHGRNVPAANTPDELKKGVSGEEVNAQIEASCALVEKLITENAELVEKVSELCIKLNQQGMPDRVSSSSGDDSQLVTAETTEVADPVHLSNEVVPVLVQKSESLEEIPIDDEVIHGDSGREMEPSSVNTKPGEAESGEVMPVSLNANGEIDMESRVIERDEEEGVPLTDAPLIGAPFRLVSFVARYVSGADLVEKNPLMSRY